MSDAIGLHRRAIWQTQRSLSARGSLAFSDLPRQKPRMLHINDLTMRIAGRALYEKATVALPEGARVGFVGRNGSGKTTLFHAIAGEIAPDEGSISLPKTARI